MIDEMLNDLSAKVGKLALVREYHSELKAELDEARAIFQAEHAELINRERYQREEVSLCEGAVRELAPAVYAAIQEKTVCPGVKIRVSKRYEYDLATATAWARSHAPEMMMLDRPMFEGRCKASPQGTPAFVREVEVITPAIDKDLSSWLPDEVGEKTAE